MGNWNASCRFFNEKYACDTLSAEGYTSCEECKFATPFSKKILIIKLGAIGDVIRTTPILPALRKKYSEDALIYWMTNPESAEVLENNPLIDKVLIYNTENILRIQQEKFDVLFALEITTPSTLLANLVNATEKFGYFFDNGVTSCFNKGAAAYLETAFLNHIKLQNRKTYQELIFEACELQYNKEKPILELTEKERMYARDFFQKKGVSDTDKLIGINFNAGSRWQSKYWSKKEVINLINSLKEHKIILLGGPQEKDIIAEVMQELKEENQRVIQNPSDNSIKQFAAIMERCDKIITTDSLALHLSISLEKPAIALFFSTPPWEIEDYGKVRKITSPLLEKYFFSHRYSDELANSITAEQVLAHLEE